MKCPALIVLMTNTALGKSIIISSLSLFNMFRQDLILNYFSFRYFGDQLVDTSKNEIIGLLSMSFSDGNGDGVPGIFTRIYPYAAWIKKITGV